MRRSGDGWFAENFDGLGFVCGLLAVGQPVAGRHVVLFGVGGAGSAIAVSLLMNDIARVWLRDVDQARCDALAARLERHWPGRVAAATGADLAAADIVVNATPLGLRPDDPLPFDPASIRADGLVADIRRPPPPACWPGMTTTRPPSGTTCGLNIYGVERGRHVRHAVRMSVDLGKVICQLDPAAARDRDAVMTGARERGVVRAPHRPRSTPCRTGSCTAGWRAT